MGSKWTLKRRRLLDLRLQEKGLGEGRGHVYLEVKVEESVKQKKVGKSGRTWI